MRQIQSVGVLSKIVTLWLALAVLGSIAPAAFAQGSSLWLNTSGGDWSNPSNWSAGVPGPLDEALFDLDSLYTVTGFSPVRIISVQRGTVTIDLGGGGISSSLDCAVSPTAFFRLLNGFIKTTSGNLTATGRGFMVTEDFAFDSATGNFTIEPQMTLIRTVIRMGSGTLQMNRADFHYSKVFGPSIIVNTKWVLYSTPIMSSIADTAVLNANLILRDWSVLQLGSVSGPGLIELRDANIIGPMSGCKIIGNGKILGELTDAVVSPGLFFEYGTIQLGDTTQTGSLVAPFEVILDVGVPDPSLRRYDQLLAFSIPPSITCCTDDGLQKQLTVRVEDFGTASTVSRTFIGDQFDLVVGSSMVWEGPFGVTLPDLGLAQQMKTVMDCRGLRAYVVDPGGAVPICADASCDGMVTFVDVNEVLSHWMSGYPNADIDENGSVGISDIMAVLNQWLSICP